MGQVDHYTHLSWDEKTVKCTMCKIETVVGMARGLSRCSTPERFSELGYDLFVVVDRIELDFCVVRIIRNKTGGEKPIRRREFGSAEIGSSNITACSAQPPLDVLFIRSTTMDGREYAGRMTMIVGNWRTGLGSTA